MVAPSTVAQTVDTHSVDIIGTTIIRRIQGYAIHQKAQMTVVVLLHNSENWAIGGLYTVVCPTTIKCTCKAVRSVFTNEAVIQRPILLMSLYSYLVEVIGSRLNKIAYLLALSINTQWNTKAQRHKELPQRKTYSRAGLASP